MWRMNVRSRDFKGPHTIGTFEPQDMHFTFYIFSLFRLYFELLKLMGKKVRNKFDVKEIKTLFLDMKHTYELSV